MFARFFIPITPLLFFLLELGVRLVFRKDSLKLAALLVIVLLVFFRFDQYKTVGKIYDISYEPRFYPYENIVKARKRGKKLRKYFKDLNVRILFHGQYAMLVYYADIPIAIENASGLTDEFIAHQPLKKRGIPGHEKHATLEYMFRRKVNFYLRPSKKQLRRIFFDDYEAEIVVYDNEIMEKLKKFPEIKFISMPEYLDSYLQNIASYPDNQVKMDYQIFKLYYFDHNDDKDRKKLFLGRLAKKT